MNDLEVLIGQMVTDISDQAQSLDPLRLDLFLHWLCAHSVQVKTGPLQPEDLEAGLKPALRSWFETLSMQGTLWEYRLVLDEIAWWRDLDDQRLHLLLKSEAGRRNG
jgi:hypothetical protein